MKEMINTAYAQGMYNGKLIRAESNPWKITAKRKDGCVCEYVHETICTSGSCVEECFISYNGVQRLKWDGKTFIRVGYGICVKYRDCDGRIKTITKQGSTLFFEPPGCGSYTVYFSNPPFSKVCQNTISVEFAVLLCG